MKDKKGSLYIRPIFITKKQLRKLNQKQMISVSRQGYTLNIALKGYSDKRADLETKILKLKNQLKKLENNNG